MECWNIGFDGMRSVFMGLAEIKNKIRTISAFDPQYSIFPSFHYSMGYLTVKTTPLG
jgi:hypothetical protein